MGNVNAASMGILNAGQQRATQRLTSDTYTSVILEMQDKTADAVAELIPRQTRGATGNRND